MSDKTKVRLLRWRYRIGRGLVHLGIRIMPAGRSRAELTALLWTWNMRVRATLSSQEMPHGR